MSFWDIVWLFLIPTEQIARARSLLDAGNITPAEYERLKEKALA